jgi:hypothetical protein
MKGLLRLGGEIHRLIRKHFQELEVLQVPDHLYHIFECNLIRDVKRLRELSGEVLDGGLPITPLPDVGSREVQVMNDLVLTIEHHRLPVYHTASDVSSPSWVLRDYHIVLVSYIFFLRKLSVLGDQAKLL